MKASMRAVLLGGAAACAISCASAPPVSTLDLECGRPDEAKAWRIYDDRLMFGDSRGAVRVEGEALLFEGEVKERAGGGWWSARRPLERPLDLSHGERLRLRFRGDGRTYGFDLRDDASLSGVYWESQVRTVPGETQEVVLTPGDGDFRPLSFGSPATSAHPLDRARIVSFAVVVGNGQTGPFRLAVDAIEVLPAP